MYVSVASFAPLTLGHVAREFPCAPQHVMGDADDLARPRELHPAFYGSFDWHSCVHGYWQLATLRRLFPDLPERAAVESRFNAALTPANLAVEADYFRRPLARGFERPYGWAWLLMLAAELARHDDDAGRRWQSAVQPLATLLAERFIDFLAKAVYPIRAGTHSNTAFALTLAQAYAASSADSVFAAALDAAARRWYLDDADCQAWEPSLDEFLSPALTEALCMRTLLPPEEFTPWLNRFLPGLRERRPHTLFTPAVVSDRTDGKIVHLDGLNLSRAWCFRGIVSALPEEDPRRPLLESAAKNHLSASLPHVAGDYMGEHWLASFALLALSDPEAPTAD